MSHQATFFLRTADDSDRRAGVHITDENLKALARHDARATVVLGTLVREALRSLEIIPASDRATNL